MVGPDYRPPTASAPTAWHEVSTSQPADHPSEPSDRSADLAAWWTTLSDPVLDSLVERALESNLDLRIAGARVTEARAARGVIAADLWPQLGASGAYAYRGSSLNAGPKIENQPGTLESLRNTAVTSGVRALGSQGNANLSNGGVSASPAGALAQGLSNVVGNKLAGDGPQASRDQNLFQAGFDATWELDVFGGTRRAIQAAEADIAALEESRRGVLVTLTSEVALNYVQLRGYQRRLAIARENIRIQEDTLELTRERFTFGFVSRLDMAQAETQLATTRSQVPALITAIRQTAYQLSVLLARPPAALLAELEAEGPLPPVPTDIPAGVPSDLLRRRPDIRQAERELAASTARIGVATADLFPRFDLTASIGPQSRTMERFFDARSLNWSAGPGVSWPVFDGWRIRSNIEVETARQEQALAGYEQTVLIAFRDVESALIAYVQEQDRAAALDQAVTAGRESLELSNDLYSRGSVDFLNVLEAQRALYLSQDQLVESQTAVVTNLVSLYKALGGGWSGPADRGQ